MNRPSGACGETGGYARDKSRDESRLGTLRACATAVVWVLCASGGWAADLREAIAALQRGDFAAAERTLRAEVVANPNEAPALSMLGVALDSQNRFQEADEFHRRAAAIAPRIADVLSNYGNHLAGMGNEAGARTEFLKAVTADPAHLNANLQLARLDLNRQNWTEALGHLKHVPEDQVDAIARKDLGFGFAAGIAFARAGQFDRAETILTRVLAADPADFNVLFNVGMVTASAGHFERARDVLETALRQQPENVDLLVRLASVHEMLKHPDAAVKLLARAAKLKPDLPEIQRMLAVATAELGALADSIAAWDRYRKLAPDDDVARRERGFSAVQLGRIDEGGADLQWYLARHPDDAVAHYQLGMAMSDTAQLDAALKLKPDFAAARSARGYLFYQQAKFEAALTDLEAAVAARAGDALLLDRLGQTYLALDRPSDAVKTLRRAAELAPGDSRIQFHLGRSLAEAGETAQSKAAMERFRQLGPAAKSGVPAGLVDYLSMTPEQQRADYRVRVEKALHDHPDDAAAQLAYLKLQIEDGKLEPERTAEAIAAMTQALPTRPDLYWHATSLLVRAGRTGEALSLLEHATDVETVLMRAVVSELAGKSEDADRLLGELQSARPEWFAVWVARAAVLAGRKHPAEARQAIETAKALGARTQDTSAGLRGLFVAGPPGGW